MSRKAGGGGGGGHGGSGSMRWLLTYADMITLLMAFFMILYSISNVDKDKYQRLARGLQIALGRSGGGSLVVLGEGEGTNVKLPEDLYRRLQQQEAAPAQAARQAEAAQPDDPLLRLGQQMVLALKPFGRFHVYVSERGVVISLLGTALFDSGRAEIRPEAEPVLAAIAERLRAVPNDISVEGSADDRPINTPEFPSNWELSTRRATEVARHLISRHGLDARRFITVGYAEVRPVFDNSTPEGRAGNRRVDIVILRERHQVTLGEELR